MNPARFSRFIGIDWSGARGHRHPSVQVAVADAGAGPPVVVAPPSGVWSRTDILGWLRLQRGDVLAGIDASFGLCTPITGEVPPPAKTLWRMIDDAGTETDDLGGHGFLDTPARDWFWTGPGPRPRADYALLRETEKRPGKGNPASNYVLKGASQVGKASLSAMRLLHRLGWPVWPFDPLPETGPVMVEIYCSVFARGKKLRTVAALDAALAALGSDPMPPAFAATYRDRKLPDHVSDALVTAAGLRRIAHDPQWWTPDGLDAARETEGWTFGVA